MRTPDNPVHEELERLPKETLIELIKMYSRNWHTCDGLWFSGVEERYGTEKVLEIDGKKKRDILYCLSWGNFIIGEYGITQEKATLDTIGVDPDYQHKGIGDQLINEFLDHLRSLGVQRINTLVDWNDSRLIHFFSANQFSPSKTINLERDL